MSQRAVVLASVVAGFLVARGGAAKLCGDAVAGQDVPCACGDVVVSDVVLTNDPVTTSVCPGDGLVVRAVGAGHGVTVDLMGKTLRGNGHGAGVWIINGGPGGARVISTGHHAHLVGFLDGIVAHGSDSVAAIERVVVQGSRRDGVRLDARGYTVHATVVQDAGRDGFAVDGRDWQLTGTQAVNSQRYGYFVRGVNGVLGQPGAGNTTQGSGRSGFNVLGVGHRVVECTARTAQTEGVRLNGMHYTVSGCVAEGNIGDGIVGSGMDWQLVGNRAQHNARNGLRVHGAQMVDGGGNRGSSNGGPPNGATQCAINGVPCGP